MPTRTLSKPQSDRVTDPASTVTIQETIQDFVRDYAARDAAEATRYRYRHYVTDYAGWLEREGHPTDMHSLQGPRGKRYVKGYLAYLRTRPENPAAPSTVATAWRVLKTFWNWCVRESIDEDNEPGNPPYVKTAPTDFVEKSDIPKDVVADDVGEPFTDAEVERIFAAIGPANSRSLEVRRNRAIVHILLCSGVRRKELASLMVNDFNPDTGLIMVRRSVAKSTNSPDDARLTTLYNSGWQEARRYVKMLRASGRGNGPLIPNLRSGKRSLRGKPMRPDSITQLLDRIVQGIQDACPNKAQHPERDGGGREGCEDCIRRGGVHRFRATWACNQLRRGAAPSAVKAAGGWRTYDMLDRYSRKVAGEVAVEEIRRVNAHR